MRPVFQWNLGGRSLELGKRTLIMGIVNVTPDSFSDGGQFLHPDQAIAHAERLLEEGADILDIGGESTRPGARVDVAVAIPVEAKSVEARKKSGANLSASGARVGKVAVSAEEELKRVLPVIGALKKKYSSAVLSIDTYKADVARAAVAAGAEIVNDVSGFRWDARMAKTVAELKCGAVIMHMRGRPEEWRTLPPPGDIVLLVKRELKEWAEKAVLAGVRGNGLCSIPVSGSAKASRRIIPCWDVSPNYRRRAFHCWRAHHGSLLLGGRWRERERTLEWKTAFMEVWRRRRRRFSKAPTSCGRTT